jgi:hypothetical protein
MAREIAAVKRMDEASAVAKIGTPSSLRKPTRAPAWRKASGEISIVRPGSWRA